MNWFEWVERVVFVLMVVVFVHSIYKWKTARLRTKAHVFAMMIAGVLILIRVPDLLELSTTGQMISLVLTFGLLVYVMWYGAGVRKERETRDKAQ